MLYMKNVNRVQKKLFLISAKDRMIHFNISVTVKCGRDNKGCDESAWYLTMQYYIVTHIVSVWVQYRKKCYKDSAYYTSVDT